MTDSPDHSAVPDFDPNASVDIKGFGSNEPPGISGEEFVAAWKIAEETAQAVDPIVFDDKASEVTKGHYTFVVECEPLKRALAAVLLVASKKSPLIRIVLFADRIKLAAKNAQAFVEAVVRTDAKGVAGLSGTNRVAFSFDLRRLRRFVLACERGDAIRFVYRAEDRRLEIADKYPFANSPRSTVKPLLLFEKDGQTTVRLDVGHDCPLPDYHEPLTNGTPIDPGLLLEGLRHASLFTRRDKKAQQNLSLIEVRDGMVVGGGHKALSMFQASGLHGMGVRVTFDNIPVLEAALSWFDESQAGPISFFETGKHRVLSNGEKLWVGFQKTHLSFPNVLNRFNVQVDSEVILARATLVERLRRISVASNASSDAAIVRLQLDGFGADATLTLRITDALGRGRGLAVLSCYRYPIDGQTSELPVVKGQVNIATLQRAVSHFKKTPNILFTVAKHAIFIRDETDGRHGALQFMATTLIPMNPEEVEPLGEGDWDTEGV